jgi:site-specific DNA recombinase
LIRGNGVPSSWTLAVHAERAQDFARYRLYYVYLNERKEGFPSPRERYRGLAILRVENGERRRLMGDYFTETHRQGTLHLTRDAAHAKLVDLFDQHSVSFVSVTQSFNTTSSMGRLTLNVLLSFAQFEREVIGERVRDKIAASKRRGIWVGGPVPLGYASINKKLVVVPEEAETVRLIFRRYLELGSIRALIQDLDRRGIRTKRQVGGNGQTRGGIRFGVGPLAHLLRNRFYIGEVVYRGEVHSGEHEPLVDQSLFEALQTKLAASATARQLRLKGSSAILTGRIFDDRGNRMTPTHTNKRGARYRYYVSHALLQKRNNEAGSVPRVPAPEIENLVVKVLRDRFAPNDDREQPTFVEDRAQLTVS